MPDLKQEVMQAAGKEVGSGQVYATIERLRVPGLVGSEMRDTLDANGRTHAMRFYWLTDAGKQELQDAFKRIRDLHEAKL